MVCGFAETQRSAPDTLYKACRSRHMLPEPGLVTAESHAKVSFVEISEALCCCENFGGESVAQKEKKLARPSEIPTKTDPFVPSPLSLITTTAPTLGPINQPIRAQNLLSRLRPAGFNPADGAHFHAHASLALRKNIQQPLRRSNSVSGPDRKLSGRCARPRGCAEGCQKCLAP